MNDAHPLPTDDEALEALVEAVHASQHGKACDCWTRPDGNPTSRLTAEALYASPRLRRLLRVGAVVASRSELLATMRERATSDEVPPCRVCGAPLTISRMGGGAATKYDCSSDEASYMRSTARTREEQRAQSDHWAGSEWTQRRAGDPWTRELLDAIDTALAEDQDDG